VTIEINRSNNQDIDGLLNGYAWGSGGAQNITFSFPTGIAEYTGYRSITDFSSLNTVQQAAVRNSLLDIASFCKLTFIETTAPDATLRYAGATVIDGDVIFGWGGSPELAYQGRGPSIPTYKQGDLWFRLSSFGDPLPGGHAHFTFMHETGHALGLKHGHSALASHGVLFPALPVDHDSIEYSVMTYRQFPGEPNIPYFDAENHPTTYMQADIAALQYLYGANYGASANNGDTVYTWSPTTGEASINGVGQGAPNANFVLMTIWDGGGNDRYDFWNYTTNLSVDLNPGGWTILDTSAAHAQRANLGTDGTVGAPTHFARGNIANALIDPRNPSETFSLIENAGGGSGNDILLGNGIGNGLWGGPGNDTLKGGGGNDTLDGESGMDALYGGDGDDTIIADGDGGTYSGDAGDDAMFAGLGFQFMDGGAGVDLIDHTIYDDDLVFNMTTGLTQFAGESYRNFEAAKMGNGHDTVTGNAANNDIFGRGGNDTLTGGGGKDGLFGGDGNDIITADGDGGVYEGNAGNDTMYAGLGVQFMDGGAGIDVIDHTIYNGALVFNMTTGLTNFAGESYRNFEIARMGNGHDTVTGNASDNYIFGAGGNDRLTGGGGKDGLFGGDGNDIITADGDGGVYNGDAGDDTMFSGAGNEFMDGGTGIDLIDHTRYNGDLVFDMTTGLTQFPGESYRNFEAAQMGDGHDTVIGNAVNNDIFGRGGNDTLIGLNGNDTLDGGPGNDILDGGTGVDTVLYANATTGVTVNLGVTTAQNTVGAGTDIVLNVENLTGSSFNDILSGNASNNVLNGATGTDMLSYANATMGVRVDLGVTMAQNTVGAGTDIVSSFENLRGSNLNDTLTGSTSNNVIIGGLGDDVLNGGAGTDTASYETATTSVIVNLLLGDAQNTGGAGTDTLSNFENLRGSNFDDILLGNAGNNVLNGAAGTDVVSYAGATAGVRVDLGLTTAQDTIGAGTDTLSNFEKLRGSNFNDTLTGNTGNNALLGLVGNDTLAGSLGNDQLYGGSGQDKFVFNTALNATTNKDTITDFSVVDDTILLENAIFTKFTATGAIPAGTFVANVGGVAVDANDYLIYNTTTGTLSYDADGNGAGAAVAFVTLLGNPALTSADFSII